MLEIVPTIIAKDFSEVQKKIKKAEPFFDWVQLDIMDGIFVNNETWREPEDLKNVKTSLNLETHLMIDAPWLTVDSWLVHGIKRVIVHWEAFEASPAIGPESLSAVIDSVKNQNKEIGIALNLGTSVDVLRYWLDKIDLVLIMAVNPGRGGQKFMPETMLKIQQLRQLWPNGKISVDGGINLQSAKECVRAGADILSIGSYLWSAADLAKAVKKFKDYLAVNLNLNNNKKVR